MSTEDPGEVLRTLQQKMEETQRQHEEELRAVRAECAARLAKGKEKVVGENEHEKTVTVDRNQMQEKEHSSALNHQENKDDKDEKTKTNQGESAALVVKTERIVPLPFVQAIMDMHISEQFVRPTFKMYDGTTDLEALIKAFTNAMAFRTGCDAIWCRAFSLSLKGEALEWFNSLPNNSIENFEVIRCMFKKQFAACNTQDITVVDLMNLRQEKEESLKTFMDRYQKTIRRVKGLTLELALQYVLPALRLGPFKD